MSPELTFFSSSEHLCRLFKSLSHLHVCTALTKMIAHVRGPIVHRLVREGLTGSGVKTDNTIVAKWSD